MDERYRKIFRYIRSDYNIAGFDLPVFVFLASGVYFVTVYVTSTYVLIVFLTLIIFASIKIQELKDAKLKGSLKQIMYHFGLVDSKYEKSQRIPTSNIKEFIG